MWRAVFRHSDDGLLFWPTGLVSKGLLEPRQPGGQGGENGHNMRNYKHLLAIPAYNEDRFVVAMVQAARAFIDNILVVDDGSADRTPVLLADMPDIHVIRHPQNLGYGRSLRDAFDFAAGNGYDWLITMDCDEQHEPSDIPRFIAETERDQADIVSGSRYLLPPEDPNVAPADRRRLNAWMTRMVNQRLGLAITDAFCGFKAYRVDGLRRLDITEPGYAMPLQLWVQAVRAGLRVVELPIRLIYKDPMRRFGGGLDDPEYRYRHYLDVFHRAMAAGAVARAGAASVCEPC